MAHPALVTMARITGIIARAAQWAAGAALVAMTAIIALHVFFRYVLDDAVQWALPSSILIMGWFIFLGGAVGVKQGYHLSFDVMLMVLPARVVGVLHSVSDVLVGVFGAGMCWFGIQLMARTADTSLPALGVSGAWGYLALCLGGVLIVVFSAERLVLRAAGLPTARFGDDPVEEVR